MISVSVAWRAHIHTPIARSTFMTSMPIYMAAPASASLIIFFVFIFD